MKDGFSDEPEKPEKGETSPKRLGDHTGAATLKVAGVRLLISNRLIAKAHYQHRTPRDTSGRNFIPKRDLTRYCHGTRNCS